LWEQKTDMEEDNKTDICPVINAGFNGLTTK